MPKIVSISLPLLVLLRAEHFVTALGRSGGSANREDGGRGQSDDSPKRPQVSEDGDLSMPGISFAFDAELYMGTGISTSSKPFQVLKINGRLVVDVSFLQFAFLIKHRLTTNADNSWSIWTKAASIQISYQIYQAQLSS